MWGNDLFVKENCWDDGGRRNENNPPPNPAPADEYVQPPEPPKDCPVNVLMDWASKMCVGGLVRLNDKQAYRVIGHFGRFELTQVDREAPISKFAYQGFDPIKTLHRVFLQKDFKKR
ncbi:hypothetical protein MRX96_045009 [Rhipicephalus microplus]